MPSVQTSVISSSMKALVLEKGRQVKSDGRLIGQCGNRGRKQIPRILKEINELIHWAELMNACAPISVLPLQLK